MGVGVRWSWGRGKKLCCCQVCERRREEVEDPGLPDPCGICNALCAGPLSESFCPLALPFCNRLLISLCASRFFMFWSVCVPVSVKWTTSWKGTCNGPKVASLNNDLVSLLFWMDAALSAVLLQHGADMSPIWNTWQERSCEDPWLSGPLCNSVQSFHAQVLQGAQQFHFSLGYPTICSSKIHLLLWAQIGSTLCQLCSSTASSASSWTSPVHKRHFAMSYTLRPWGTKVERKFIDKISEGQNCSMHAICGDNCTTIPMDVFVQRNLACVSLPERQDCTHPPLT